MNVIKTFSTMLQAELARVALTGEGIASQVVGVDIGLEGGFSGIKLLVEDGDREAALKVLGGA
jgi:hypothetical protein